MGNSLPGEIKFNLSEQGWIRSHSSEGAIIWTNANTQQELEQYSFIINDNDQLKSEQSAYRLRFNSPILVSGKYFKKQNNQQYCSQLTKGYLYTERIAARINEIEMSLDYGGVLCLIKKCFEGFGLLVKNVGTFDINQNMICFNKQGSMKVWLNSDLSKSMPDSKFNRSLVSQQSMIRRIIDIMDQNINYRDAEHDPHQSFKDYLNSRNISSFVDAYNAVDEYVNIHHIYLPGNVEVILPRGQNNSNQRIRKIVTTCSSAPINDILKSAPAPKSNNHDVRKNVTQIQPNVVLNQRPKPIETTISSRPLSELIHSHPNNIHNERLASTLNFQSRPPTHIPTQIVNSPQLHHSQSLLNLNIPKYHYISHSNIMNYKNRSEISRQTQSLINMHQQAASVRPQKHINEYIKQPKLYSKNSNTYKVQHRKDSEPFAFSFNAPKAKVIENNNIKHTFNRTHNDFKRNKTVDRVKNFKSANSIKPTSKIRNELRLPKSPLPHFQFTPKQHQSNTLIGESQKQHRLNNGNNLHLIEAQKRHQIGSNRKVSEVYLQIDDKKIEHQNNNRVNTQPNPQRIYFNNHRVTENGLVFRDKARNQQIKTQITSNKPGKLISNHHILSNHQLVPSVRTNTSNPSKAQELPMAFSSQYMKPNTKLVIESFNPELRTSQNHKDTVMTSIDMKSNYQSYSLQNNSYTNRTIKEQRQSINQSAQNTPNYTYDINSQILQDLERLKANIANLAKS